MTTRILVRPARPDDAPLAAAIFRLSMNHLTERLFGENGRQTEIALMRLFSKNAGRFGYGSAYVAEWGHRALGLMVAFPGTEAGRLSFSVVRHLPRAVGLGFFGILARGLSWRKLKEAEPGEYYVSMLGVLPAAQGQGLGKHLLLHADEQAHASGLTKCSSIISTDNDHALRLFKRNGYQVVFTQTDENPLASYHRMVKSIG